MARITVEDCLDNVDNRFELVMLASKRARQMAIGGKDPLVEDDSDKATVIALREIAEGLITPEVLARESEIEAEEELAASFETPSSDTVTRWRWWQQHYRHSAVHSPGLPAPGNLPARNRARQGDSLQIVLCLL